MLDGSALPSPSASRPQRAQVPGKNCMGPTARSSPASPSRRPPSVSVTRAVPPLPSRRGPTMREVMPGSCPGVAPRLRPWSDSTLPIAASTGQGRPGQLAAACW